MLFRATEVASDLDQSCKNMGVECLTLLNVNVVVLKPAESSTRPCSTRRAESAMKMAWNESGKTHQDFTGSPTKAMSSSQSSKPKPVIDIRQ